MKIAVVSMRGGSGGAGPSADFDASGGSIGRSATNQLVLDDPDRTVSRVHAQVLCRNGAFFIVDRGSNPLSHNGRALGAGVEAPLTDGDKLRIGGFELLVSQAQGAHGATPAGLLDDFTMGGASQPKIVASADDPFADLLEGLTPVQAAVSASAVRASAAPAALFPDPMGLDSPAAKPGKPDPFDDLMGLGNNQAAAPASRSDAFAGLPNATSSSLDDLFGLGAPSGGADPLALSPLANPLFQPSAADPMHALLGDAPKPTVASRSDHVPLLQQAYTLPTAADTKPAPLAPLPAPPPAPSIAPAPPPPTAPAPIARAAPHAAVPTGTASDAELLAAFLRGVKSNHQMPTELTPELMERIGAMLHTATHGTLQLLLSRQEFKKVLHSEVTMIAMAANNPLKFSPNAEVALAHMLGPKVKGFMAAEDAMNNAYADLRAHQFGVMVGMRAALSHVLGLFTPEKLEARLTEKSAIDALFASNRKAKLWDQFCKLYAGIATEAEDDFHTLFGKAFSKAYDQQMARFKSDT